MRDFPEQLYYKIRLGKLPLKVNGIAPVKKKKLKNSTHHLLFPIFLRKECLHISVYSSLRKRK